MTESFDEDPALAMAGESALIDTPAPTERPEALLALYRRYRPETFAEVIGQEHVTEPLQRALANNRVNHAYLFSGPRGCGKTTSARILARALNCERGPAPVPCGECQSCIGLARGGSGSIDVIEIDAASHGGVDDARDLRERAFFAPVHSRYKIYIVDEAHMVTTAGFNAMLKLVEEPPPHVKFIFATTEPEKVIGTIRSRTHHYPFRLVPPKVLGGYLAEVCESEGVKIERTVLPLVVRAGGGSVRDSLSVLDQLLGGAADTGVSYEQASALLGFTPDSLLDEIVDAFAAGDGAGVFASIDKVVEVGQDPRRFAEDLLRRFRDLVIVTQVPDAISSGLVDVSADQAERLTSQGAALGTGELTRAAEVLARGITEMRGTTAPRLHLELMCARILLPEADLDSRGLHARVDRLERRVGVSGDVDYEPAAPAPRPESARPAPRSEAPPQPAQQPPASPDPTPPAAPAPAAPPPAAPADQEPAAERPVAQPPVAQPSEAQPPAPPMQPPTAEFEPATPPQQHQPAAAVPTEPPTATEPAAPRSGLSTADLRRLWPEVLDEVKRRRRFTWILLSQNAQVIDVVDGVLTLALPNAGARDNFSRGGSEDILKDALVQVVGVDLRISTVVDSGAGGSRGRGAPQQRTRPPEPPPSAPPAARPEPAPAPPPEQSREPAPRPSTPRRDDAPRVDEEPPPDPWDDPAPPDDQFNAPVAPPNPMVGRAVSEAKEQIRPTRRASSVPTPAEQDEPFDESLADSAVVIDDSSSASHAELLKQYLGAELIGEEDPRP